jgi:capsular exopolysaccharide synthesis family protein
LLYLKDSISPENFDIKFSKNGLGYSVTSDSLNSAFNLNDTVETRNVSFVLLPKDTKNHADQDYHVVISTTDATAEKYLNALTFNINDKQASVIQINLEETVPQKGEDILNKLYEVYTRINEDDKNKIADSTINFIDRRLAIVSSELSGVEKNIEQFKIANNLSTDMSEQSRLTLDNASDIQQQITTQDVQISVVQSLIDYLNEKAEKVVPNVAVIQDPTYISTVQEYNTLVLERDRQLQTTKANNPVIENLNSQIEGVKSNLLISLGNIKRQMLVSKTELQKKNDQIMGLIKTGPTMERAFLDISRQQDVKQQLYLFLLQKREETAISKSGTLSNSRLIEPGKSDRLPFSPNKPIIYLIGFCAGILIPSGVIYFKRLMNNTVQNPSDISKETKVPIIGEIGHNTSGETIVTEPNSRTALAEQFRALRTNFQFLLKGKNHQVIMLTSSTSGEGKSFLTINLGTALAISNRKVVLIELDLRKPKISKEFGLSVEPGLSGYLIGKYKKEEIVKPTPTHPNLFIISSGALPPNPAELLLAEEFVDLFGWLRKQFDFIIVDTPPAGMVIDPVLIAKYVDASVYIVRQGYTLKQQLGMINEFKQYEKMPNLSILLNDVRLNKAYGYKYGYRYGYGYGYGYGNGYYSDNKKSRNNFFKKAIKSNSRIKKDSN